MRKLTFIAFGFVILSASAFAGDDARVVRPRLDDLSRSAAVSVPNIIRFTGYLHDHQGNPVSGTHTVTTALFSVQQGGAALWQETQQVAADIDGRYSILLGATTAGGVALDLFTTGQAQWIDVQSPDAAPMNRSRIVSVPYAMKAHDADTVGGIPASQLMRINPDTGVQTTQANSPVGDGTITSADLQGEALLRQQADAQVLQQAKQYADNAVATAVTGSGNQSLSAVQGETLRAKQSEQSLYTTASQEGARAQAAENLLTMQIAAVSGAVSNATALPHGVFLASPAPVAPAGYVFTGLSMQATGSPTPEAEILMGTVGHTQSSFTLYLYMRAN